MGEQVGHPAAAPAGTAAPPGLPADLSARLRAHLEVLYGPDTAAEVTPRLAGLCAAFAARLADRPRRRGVDESDVLLITYGDQVREHDRRPLETLRRFLSDHLADLTSGVHLLPHYPSTSDDGFAVSDYHRVDPALGTWRDVLRMGREVDLMLDAVVNHTSASGTWFRRWARGEPAFDDFFVALPRDTDTSTVVRPRTTPLLSPVETARGLEFVWTTFSADQVDLNYANPEVLLAVTEVLLTYVEHGARLLRLDAVAFLAKRLGTSCVHLPETHEIVKFWRTVVDAVAPGTLLVTETNVPHDENVSYFGDGTDEAHLVYQFPLPPLTLAAFHLADASGLAEWIATLSTPSPSTSFLNFLGSHDGIGLRPVEGLLTPAEIDHLCTLVQSQGGGVSYRAREDGSMSAYELNTVFFDALNPPHVDEPDDLRIHRFIAAHSVLMALKGVPLLYIQAAIGSHNWTDGVRRSGRLRSINRQKFEKATLEAELADPSSHRRRVLDGLRELVAIRRYERAFHPAGEQRVLASPAPVLALLRTSPDGRRRVVAVTNVSGRPQSVRLGADPALRSAFVDLFDGRTERGSEEGVLEIGVAPYGVRWLATTIPSA